MNAVQVKRCFGACGIGKRCVAVDEKTINIKSKFKVGNKTSCKKETIMEHTKCKCVKLVDSKTSCKSVRALAFLLNILVECLYISVIQLKVFPPRSTATVYMAFDYF